MADRSQTALDTPASTEWEVDAPTAAKVIRVRGRLHATGLLDDLTSATYAAEALQDTTMDLRSITRDLQVLADAGLARSGVATFLVTDPTPQSLDAVLDDALDALEHNPMPATEWAGARQVLGDELLGAITEVSPTSLRRYAVAERPTPDDVAARLHFLALVNADLAGSYNDLGVRRWWQRPRSQLAGRSPIEALGDTWDPDTSEPAASVRALAASLAGAGSAT